MEIMSSIVDWFKWRFKERTSWHGIIIGGAALLVLFGVFPLIKIVALGAVVWAVYSFVKPE